MNIDDVVNENMGLVKFFANKYSFRPEIQFDDLVQEGVIALINAAKNYNSELGKFGSYASIAIKRRMCSYITEVLNPSGINVNNIVSMDDTTVDDLDYHSILGDEPESDDYGWLRLKLENIINSKLTTREKKVINCLYGLNGETESTIDVVAKNLNLTKEKIRKVQSVAIRKLRNHLMTEELDVYLMQ